MIVAVLASALFLTAYALDLESGGEFVTLLAAMGAVAFAAAKGGAFSWLRVAAAKHRQVLMLGAVGWFLLRGHAA